MLDAMGAADVLFDRGLRAPEYQFRDRQTNEVFSFDLTEIADHTRFPYRIQCEQHLVAHDLANRLGKDEHTVVRYLNRLLFLEQDDAGVTAYVETPRALEKYRAFYLIGADGANSVVRKLLDLEFSGFTYSEKFLCFSTEYPIEQAFENLCYVNYVSDPNEWMVLLRVPKLWRVLVPAAESIPDATLLSDATKNDVFRRMLGSDNPDQSRGPRHRAQDRS
jgi:3-(3-hydroxy-phenyl)propionate hydroxylase